MKSVKEINEEKLSYLRMVLQANGESSPVAPKNGFKIYYSISLIRFNAKTPVVVREPASTNISAQITKYSGTFLPDYLIVDLYSGRSRNVKKPFATFKFDYRWMKGV